MHWSTFVLYFVLHFFRESQWVLWVFLYENFPYQPAADSLFLNSVDLSFLMEVKSDVIKEINSAKMSQ